MDWQVDASRKRSVDDLSIPIDQHIRTARAILEERSKEIPRMREKVAEITRFAESLGDKRSTIRRRRDLLLEAQAIIAEMNDIEQGRHLEKFDESAATFLQAFYKQNSRTVKSKHMARRLTLPGESDVEFHQCEGDTPQGDVVSEFLTEMRNMPPKMRVERDDVCPHCCTQMRIVQAKAVVSCTSCGYMASYLDATTSSISYGEDVEFTSFSYKRINHFNEWLQNFQAKESYEIPQAVIDAVMEELHKQRVTETSQITAKRVREVLKQLRFRKTYEHTAQIQEKCTGVPAPRLSAATEEMCRLMFKATQPAFERHKPADRSNFLSYSYTLYKFLQLLGHDELLDRFTLLKGRDKLVKQDLIWKKICQDMDWEFVPSV